MREQKSLPAEQTQELTAFPAEAQAVLAGRPHGRAARRHLRTAAMKKSDAAGISRESVATVASGIRPSRLQKRWGRCAKSMPSGTN